jgi:L-seryl-tRNA(Ser) seleniumtransferase
MDIRESLKKLPSVENVLQDKRIESSITLISRRGVTRIVREAIAACRERILRGDIDASREDGLREEIVGEVAAELSSLSAERQRRVINATGVVLHTNLGRAVLGEEACRAIIAAAAGYTDLEIDIRTGRRVERTRRARRLIALLTGSEDAIIVNNNAAAVLLAVQTFAGTGGVAISRGELVEIGGSFRLPEILASAAAEVIEIGTTNRTHIRDYEDAIRRGATLLLKVHTSNYRIVGYTNEVPLAQLVELGRREGVPVMYDQGSGVLYPLHENGIGGEDCIWDIVDTGVDLVSFSADKVLGAPQGGVIIGAAELVDRLRRNHLSRALRVDKLTLAGLESVLQQYWLGEFGGIPSLGMIISDADAIESRARAFAKSFEKRVVESLVVKVVEGESSIGGGSFPINPLRTALVEINLPSGLADRLAESMRRGDPGILVRVKGESVLIDLRTVSPDDENVLLTRLQDTIERIRERE